MLVECIDSVPKNQRKKKTLIGVALGSYSVHLYDIIKCEYIRSTVMLSKKRIAEIASGRVVILGRVFQTSDEGMGGVCVGPWRWGS